MEIRYDLTQVYNTARHGPEKLLASLNKAVTLATVVVLAEAQDRRNWEQAPVAPGGGRSVGRSVRGVRNDTDRLRAVTGYLLRSYTRRVSPDGRGFIGTVGSPTVYARIHEFGGNAGRNHAAYLRPRPVLGRAIQAKRSQVLALIQKSLEVA